MLKIRLSRIGKSNTPIYRLVVAEKTRAVKRENIEILGLYNPTNKEDKFQVKKDRVLHWIGLGAQPSDTVRNLLCDFDVLPKKDKVKIVHGKATKKKDKKEETTQKVDTEAAQKESPEASEKTDAVVSENPDEPKVSDENVPEEAPTPEKIEEPENNINEETAPTADTEVPQK